MERTLSIPWGGSVDLHHPGRRRRGGIRRPQGEDHLGHQHQQRDRQDRHPPDQGLRPVRQRARVPVARPGRPEDGPAAVQGAGDRTRRPAPVRTWSRTSTSATRSTSFRTRTGRRTPGIPKAKLSFEEKINSNVNANALSVLNNQRDIFDWADTIPGSLLCQINAKAKSRYKLVNLGGSVYYFFLNASKPPFNNLNAREAVVTGLNQNGSQPPGLRHAEARAASSCRRLSRVTRRGTCPLANPATATSPRPRSWSRSPVRPTCRSRSTASSAHRACSGWRPTSRS